MLDLAYLENGEIEKATHSGQALAIYEELGDLRNQALILNNQGLIAHDASRWDDSGALYGRGLAIADQIGDRSLGALMKYNLSEILIDQGRYVEAEPLIREVIRLWRASGAEGDVAEGQRELARLLARRGDVEGARPLLEAARAYQSQTASKARSCGPMPGSPRCCIAGPGRRGAGRHRWRRPPGVARPMAARPGADAVPPPRVGLRPERASRRR